MRTDFEKRGRYLIPIAIIAGLAFGHPLIVPVAAFGWCVLLLSGGTFGFEQSLAEPFALAAANAAVGVAVRQVVQRSATWCWKRLRRPSML